MPLIQHVRSRASELRAALAAVRAPEPDLLWVANAVGGPLDGTSVWVDGRVADIERALDAGDDLMPARVAALTPYSDEDQAQAFVTSSGDWVHARSVNDVELGEQPAPIERPA